MDSIIVCATGCSVNDIDWDKYKHIPKLAVNQFFMKDLPTEYYLVTDHACVRNHNPNFLSTVGKWPNTKYFIGDKVRLPVEYNELTNIVRVKIYTRPIADRESFNDSWAKNISQPLFQTRTVIFPAINLADVLGAQKIYIAGLDGYWGHFYKPESCTKEAFHYSASKKYDSRRKVFQTLEIIQLFLSEKDVKLYNMNPESFYVEEEIMTYGRPEN